MTAILPFVTPQWFTDLGAPAAGYTLTFYAAGTQNLKPIYVDLNGNTQAPNPFTLDAAGRANAGSTGPIRLGPGLYDVVLKDTDGATIWTYPNVSADSGGGGGAGALGIVNTINDLRNLGDGAYAQVLVLGYYAAGDKGCGLFLWKGSISTADDGGVFIQPADMPAIGRWQRDESFRLTALSYGAYGDAGAHSDTQSIINYLLYITSIGNKVAAIFPVPFYGSGASAVYELPVTDASFLNFTGTIRIEPGAMIDTGDCGTIVTKNFTLDAGCYQIFAGFAISGVIQWLAQAKFTSGPWLEWWGAIGDNTFNSTLALESAIGTGIFSLMCGPGFFLVDQTQNTQFLYNISGVGVANFTMWLAGYIYRLDKTTLIVGPGFYATGTGTTLSAYNLTIFLAAIINGTITGGADITAIGNIIAGYIASPVAGAGPTGKLKQRIGTSTQYGYLSTRLFMFVDNTNSYITHANTAGGVQLMSGLVKAYTLLNNGDAIEVEAWGWFGLAADAYTVIVELNTSGTSGTGLRPFVCVATNTGLPTWYVKVRFIRIDATHMAVMSDGLISAVSYQLPASYGALVASSGGGIPNADAQLSLLTNGSGGAAFDFTADMTCKVMAKNGSGGATATIQQVVMEAKYIPAG